MELGLLLVGTVARFALAASLYDRARQLLQPGFLLGRQHDRRHVGLSLHEGDLGHLDLGHTLRDPCFELGEMIAMTFLLRLIGPPPFEQVGHPGSGFDQGRRLLHDGGERMADVGEIGGYARVHQRLPVAGLVAPEVLEAGGRGRVEVGPDHLHRHRFDAGPALELVQFSLKGRSGCASAGRLVGVDDDVLGRDRADQFGRRRAGHLDQPHIGLDQAMDTGSVPVGEGAGGVDDRLTVVDPSALHDRQERVQVQRARLTTEVETEQAHGIPIDPIRRRV